MKVIAEEKETAEIRKEALETNTLEQAMCIIIAASVITSLLAILCLLGIVGRRLYKIHLTLYLIHQDLVKIFIGTQSR